MSMSFGSASLIQGMGLNFNNLALGIDYLGSNSSIYEPELTDVKVNISNKDVVSIHRNKPIQKPKLNKRAILHKFDIIGKKDNTSLKDEDLSSSNLIRSIENFDFNFDDIQDNETINDTYSEFSEVGENIEEAVEANAIYAMLQAGGLNETSEYTDDIEFEDEESEEDYYNQPVDSNDDINNDIDSEEDYDDSTEEDDDLDFDDDEDEDDYYNAQSNIDKTVAIENNTNEFQKENQEVEDREDEEEINDFDFDDDEEDSYENNDISINNTNNNTSIEDEDDFNIEDEEEDIDNDTDDDDFDFDEDDEDDAYGYNNENNSIAKQPQVNTNVTQENIVKNTNKNDDRLDQLSRQNEELIKQMEELKKQLEAQKLASVEKPKDNNINIAINTESNDTHKNGNNTRAKKETVKKNKPVAKQPTQARQVSKAREPEITNKPLTDIDRYNDMPIDKLFNAVSNFMDRAGVQNSLVQIDLLSSKFGRENIRRLLVRNYLIKIGDGVTKGK